MTDLIIQTSKIKAFQYLCDLCDYCGYDRKWTEELWRDIAISQQLFDELVYYLENHALLDRVQIEGYGLSDLYVFQMDKYNLIREIGKNTAECNKERMVLNAFRMMIDMKKNPEVYIKRMELGRGEDKL